MAVMAPVDVCTAKNAVSKSSVTLITRSILILHEKKTDCSSRNNQFSKQLILFTLTNLSAAAEAGAFIHGKRTGSNVAGNIGLSIEVAAIALNVALNAAVDVHLAGVDIALDVGHLADGHLAGVGLNLAFDVTIDVHIVLETDGTDNLDTGGKNVRGVRAHDVSKI